MRKLSLFALFFLYCPISVYAYNIKKDQIFLYTPPSADSTPVSGQPITISADKNITQSQIKLQQYSVLTIAHRSCTEDQADPGGWQSGNISGFVGHLVGLPKKTMIATSSDGNGGKISYEIIPETNNWNPWSEVTSPDFNFYTNYDGNTWGAQPASAGFHKCWNVGGTVGIDDAHVAPAIPVSISINRSMAIPGKYEMRIPFYWGYIEWKIHNATTPSFNRDWSTLVYRPEARRELIIPVTVVSQCTVNTNSISLEHGIMTPAAAINNKTSSSISLTCTSNATVKLSLQGGFKDNISKCGASGTCELTFGDTDKYSQDLTFSGTMEIPVQSKFVPGSTHPAAGKFESHAVLEIDVK